MTYQEKLNHLEEILRADTTLTLDDFFSLSVRPSEICMQWDSSNKKIQFSDMVEAFDKLSKFSYIMDYSCVWNDEHYLFEISFDVRELEKVELYSVRVVIH